MNQSDGICTTIGVTFSTETVILGSTEFTSVVAGPLHYGRVFS